MRPDEIKVMIEKMMWALYGRPYAWGGDDPIRGLDCSGGIIEILVSCDLFPVRFDTSAQGIHKFFRSIALGRAVPFSEMPQFGDLLFFGKTSDLITHVAMAKTAEVMFEFGGGDSKTTTVDAAIKQNAYGRFRPITARSDLCAVTRILSLHE